MIPKIFPPSLVGRLALSFAAVLSPLSGLQSIEPPARPLVSADSESPIVGAIRWDAWYGGGDVSQAVANTLGQPKYHYRLPWFARVLGADKVQIGGDSEDTIAKEITYAAQAGLNYWAFLHYWEDSEELGIGLNRYLAAKDKKGIRYCLLEEGGRLDKIGNAVLPRLVEHFKSPDYQTVLGGRPLLFVYTSPNTLGRDAWDALKHQTIEAGLKAPYLVLMGWEPAQDAKDMAKLGFDALSAYARGGSYSMEQPAYTEQGRLLKENLWDKWQKLHIPCITLASAGWDTRPRNERPPSWIQNIVGQPAPDPTPFSEQKPLFDSVTATPGQLASHLVDALQWTKAHRDINPANAIIIYAWNEHDEGGWLQPTLGTDGTPNEERIKALARVLHPPATPPAK